VHERNEERHATRRDRVGYLVIYGKGNAQGDLLHLNGRAATFSTAAVAPSRPHWSRATAELFCAVTDDDFSSETSAESPRPAAIAAAFAGKALRFAIVADAPSCITTEGDLSSAIRGKIPPAIAALFASFAQIG
jgi:hypothetical protein